jgi:hypothetical protein
MSIPKVGAWQSDPDGYDDAERVYDDRGQLVGGYDARHDMGYAWFAAMPFRAPLTGNAGTTREARRDVRDVLATWADVSDLKGTE